MAAQCANTITTCKAAVLTELERWPRRLTQGHWGKTGNQKPQHNCIAATTIVNIHCPLLLYALCFSCVAFAVVFSTKSQPP